MRAALLSLLALPLVAGDIVAWVPPYRLADSRKVLTHAPDGITADQWLTRLGLQFWIPDAEGKLRYADRGETLTDADVATFRSWAKAHGVEVLLTVYNHDGKRWDWARAKRAFKDHRATFIASLIAEMERHQLDGIDLDLEGEGQLDADRAVYADFVKALSRAVRAKGKKLTVDTFHSPCFNAPNMAWWADWKGHVDGLHSMGYGDLAETSTATFTADGDKTPCAGGAPIFKFSWQRDFALKAGFRADQLALGIPGWRFEWAGAPLTKHLEDAAKIGSAVAIWDFPATLGGEKDPRWGSAEVWKALVRFRSRR